MLAIVETGGKQYQFQEGRYIDIEFLNVEENSKVEFDKIVMVIAGEDSKIGQPYLEGALIKGTVLKNGKSKKVIVYKQRCKKGYRNKNGHRQLFSRVMIDSIEFQGKEDIKEEVKAEKKVTTKKTAVKKTTTKKEVTE
ncbi:MAG: 50S ribosomal protein L21 [Candidatus Gastranaerophilaceae bacterium]|jgi:large subunit ribosomal protein L21